MLASLGDLLDSLLIAGRKIPLNIEQLNPSDVPATALESVRLMGDQK